jgi:YVTN family beta-propeller protein
MAVVTLFAGGLSRAASPPEVGPAAALQPDGRLLHPAGKEIPLGNLPLGGALTPNGRYLWGLASGFGTDEIDIAEVNPPNPCFVGPRGDTCRRARLSKMRVVQRIPMPGLTGGMAFSPSGGRAYVAGSPAASGDAVGASALGSEGEAIHVFATSPRTGLANELRTIPIPPPADAPIPPNFRAAPKRMSWPERVAASPDGRTLLVSLNLAASAAIVDLATQSISYVHTGAYPYGVAFARRGQLGLVSNEGEGTVTVIDLANATVLKQIVVGGPLSHPEGIAVDDVHQRAYVAVTGDDEVISIDLGGLTVNGRLSLRQPQGTGVAPLDVGVGDQGRTLLVADSGEDAIAVLGAAPRGHAEVLRLKGRVPVAAYPVAAYLTPKADELVWLSAKGRGVGPNVHGEYIGAHIDGEGGVLPNPSVARLRQLSRTAASELVPLDASRAPAGTPIRPGGPIQHVFYIVKENRTYDQLLGDDPRGDGDPSLTLFGQSVTPNLHALARRFPLLDAVFADSAASTEGHSWTSAGDVSDYTSRNYPANYSGRGRPYDFGLYAISWAPTRFIFDQASTQGISYLNYGEAYAGTAPINDPTRPSALSAAADARLSHADLGPPWGGCYPSVLIVGGTNFLDKNEQVFDSSPPPGAASNAESRFDCFRAHFTQQLLDGTVPALNYLVLPDDHTAGTTPGARTPRAMIAENDWALGQIVDLISHSPIWSSSLILVLEDDSQSGADHVDAHRIPALVISPYARAGAVVHDRYDQLSFLRTLEIVLGINPLGLFDSLATPLYDAFDSAADNTAPYNAVPPAVNLLERNTKLAPDAKLSASLDFRLPDLVPQRVLDRILWRSVHGAASPAPQPGPFAVPETADAG